MCQESESLQRLKKEMSDKRAEENDSVPSLSDTAHSPGIM